MGARTLLTCLCKLTYTEEKTPKKRLGNKQVQNEQFSEEKRFILRYTEKEE